MRTPYVLVLRIPEVHVRGWRKYFMFIEQQQIFYVFLVASAAIVTYQGYSSIITTTTRTLYTVEHSSLRLTASLFRYAPKMQQMGLIAVRYITGLRDLFAVPAVSYTHLTLPTICSV